MYDNCVGVRMFILQTFQSLHSLWRKTDVFRVMRKISDNICYFIHFAWKTPTHIHFLPLIELLILDTLIHHLSFIIILTRISNSLFEGQPVKVRKNREMRNSSTPAGTQLFPRIFKEDRQTGQTMKEKWRYGLWIRFLASLSSVSNWYQIFLAISTILRNFPLHCLCTDS